MNVDANLLRFLGSRIAMVRAAGQQPLTDGLYPLVASYALIYDTTKIGGANLQPAGGCGQSFDADQALSSAIGEVLERHGASCEPFGGVVLHGSYDRLHREHRLVPLEDIRLFSEEQLRTVGFRFRDLSRNEELRWRAGISITKTGREEIFYPQLRLTLDRDKCDRVDSPNTNGFAIASNFETAAESAVSEVLERDAFLTHWWLRRSPPSYTFDDLIGQELGPAKDIVAWLKDRFFILDFTDQWGVPNFTGLIYGRVERGEHPLAICGACHSDPRVALSKCIIETARVYLSLPHLLEKGPKLADVDSFEKSINSIFDIGNTYMKPEMVDRTRFLLDGVRPGPAVLRERLAAPRRPIISTLIERDVSVHVLDMTPIDLSLGGLTLVRASLPEAIPMNIAHAARPWGCKKLRGFSSVHLNPFPQPFL